jgi:hypothetical protein
MIVKTLRNTGISSDVLQLAAMGSIAASILTWRSAKAKGDSAHGERLGIFIGLWAPTFFALSDAVAQDELK